MPMGIVSDADLEKEKVSGLIENIKKPGRKEGDNNVPDVVRNIISDTAIQDGRKEAVALASMFGVSASSVDAYTSGRTSTAHNKESDDNLRSQNRKTRNNIVAKAQSKIVSALDSITPTSLENLNAVEKSQVAKNLAGIVKDFAPELKEDPHVNLQQQLVIFAPATLDESKFPVINAHGE